MHSLIPFSPLFCSITFDCHLSQFSVSYSRGIRLNSNSSRVRFSLYSLGADPQKTPLPALLRVNSLLQRCVYSRVAQQRAWRGPTENATCNTFSIVAWRHSASNAFLCCTCTGHYLATAVSLPPQFLFRANAPLFLCLHLKISQLGNHAERDVLLPLKAKQSL
jgi:hypothetical protein